MGKKFMVLYNKLKFVHFNIFLAFMNTHSIEHFASKIIVPLTLLNSSPQEKQIILMFLH